MSGLFLQRSVRLRELSRRKRFDAVDVKYDQYVLQVWVKSIWILMGGGDVMLLEDGDGKRNSG